MRHYFWLLALLGLSACVHATAQSQSAQVAPSAQATQPANPEVRVGKYGIACLTYSDPSHPANLSYNANDIGKAGVPKPDLEDLTMLQRIRRYVKSPTLRLAYIDGKMIVFDASAGPCADFAAGYWVMNSKEPNLYFEPGESPNFVHAGPPDGVPTAGPWMRPR